MSFPNRYSTGNCFSIRILSFRGFFQIIKGGDGCADELNGSAGNYEDTCSDALPSNLKIIRGFKHSVRSRMLYLVYVID